MCLFTSLGTIFSAVKDLLFKKRGAGCWNHLYQLPPPPGVSSSVRGTVRPRRVIWKGFCARICARDARVLCVAFAAAGGREAEGNLRGRLSTSARCC